LSDYCGFHTGPVFLINLFAFEMENRHFEEALLFCYKTKVCHGALKETHTDIQQPQKLSIKGTASIQL